MLKTTTNKRKKIYYLCHGASDGRKKDFKLLPSAMPVIEYVTECLIELGYSVETVSAYMIHKGIQLIKRDGDDKCGYVYLPSIGAKTALGRSIALRVFHFEIFLYLLTKVRRNDTLIIYHSMGFINLITALMKIKRVNVILQIEEYYSYVNIGADKSWRNKELKYFRLFDRFIFVNDVMKEELDHKYNCVLYGPYRMSNSIRKERDFGDMNGDIIKIVYAGGITKMKAAETTIKTAEYLPDNYRVVVIGYGDDESISELKKAVLEQNKRAGFEKTSYEGFYFGEDYDRFLSQCDIGISLYESPDGELEDATKYMFSSKIMSYLSHGLYVVASETTSLMKSVLLEEVKTTPDMKPINVAKAILSVDFANESNAFDIITDMDNKFKKDLDIVISG